VRAITSSLCAQEFNKVRNIEIAKKILDALKEAHEGTDKVYSSQNLSFWS
jgi:hypothetical protein